MGTRLGAVVSVEDQAHPALHDERDGDRLAREDSSEALDELQVEASRLEGPDVRAPGQDRRLQEGRLPQRDNRLPDDLAGECPGIDSPNSPTPRAQSPSTEKTTARVRIWEAIRRRSSITSPEKSAV